MIQRSSYDVEVQKFRHPLLRFWRFRQSPFSEPRVSHLVLFFLLLINEQRCLDLIQTAGLPHKFVQQHWNDGSRLNEKKLFKNQQQTTPVSAGCSEHSYSGDACSLRMAVSVNIIWLFIIMSQVVLGWSLKYSFPSIFSVNLIYGLKMVKEVFHREEWF